MILENTGLALHIVFLLKLVALQTARICPIDILGAFEI
jgi:hypothetical protein